MLTTKGHRIGAAPLVIDHRNNKSEDVKRRGAMVIGVGMLQSERETWEGSVAKDGRKLRSGKILNVKKNDVKRINFLDTSIIYTMVSIVTRYYGLQKY
jgi:hypothetical protein